MNKIELKNHEIEGEITYSETCCSVDLITGVFSGIISAAMAVHKIDPVSSVSWVLDSDHYDFVVTMADDREWIQTVRVEAGLAWMTYDVKDEFSARPMSAALLLRKRLIEASVLYRVSKIRLEWFL